MVCPRSQVIHLLLFISLCIFNFSFASVFLEQSLKKIEGKVEGTQIPNIDFIYLINLDKRTDRLTRSTEQLSKYHISPHRFPAVYGPLLTKKELDNIGLKFGPMMSSYLWVLTPSENGQLEFHFLNNSLDGFTVFSQYMNLGAIGCALSHLSILQDAYDSGYETIWVMEDDILLKKDPHCLSKLIDELDHLIGTDGWDILYTDRDEYKHNKLDNIEFWWMERPDFISINPALFTHRQRINANFTQIGSRTRTHSMIIRRSGIKKILDHIKNNGVFLPYDHDIAFAEGIQLFMLNYPVVTWEVSPSDIH